MAVETSVGRLEDVPLREVWKHEQYSFSAWLRDNVDALQQALNLRIDITHAEYPVGGYALDLYGRDLDHDAVLIIENQLTGTDHDHLGKLLTYAAGTDARTIIWIAPQFRDEHRQALDWLNQQSDETVRFFGVVLRAVRIGDSLPAPLFDPVAFPNDWQKYVRAAARTQDATSSKGALYHRFWDEFISRIAVDHADWGVRRRSGPYDNWMILGAAFPGTVFSAVFPAGGKIRHELYIDAGARERNEVLFASAREHLERNHPDYAARLFFDVNPARRGMRIAIDGAGSIEREEEWDAYVDWFFASGDEMRQRLRGWSGG